MMARGLFNRIAINESTGCWEYIGPRSSKGYGIMPFRGRKERVHRIAAMLWLGFNPQSGLFVLHACDNPPCFNPKHLFLGTLADNNRDMADKKSIAIPRKLTACEVTSWCRGIFLRGLRSSGEGAV